MIQAMFEEDYETGLWSDVLNESEYEKSYKSITKVVTLFYRTNGGYGLPLMHRLSYSNLGSAVKVGFTLTQIPLRAQTGIGKTC